MKSFRGSNAAKVAGSALLVLALGSAGARANDLWVTSLSDSGPGSLREAMLASNSSPGLQNIKFGHALTQLACDTAVLDLQTPLPAIVDSVVIDGYSATYSKQNTSHHVFDVRHCVRIRPAIGSAVEVAFEVLANAPAETALEVKGVQFDGFTRAAIQLDGGATHVIKGNAFGGNAAMHNGIGVKVGIGVQDVWIGGLDYHAINWFGGSTLAAVVDQGTSNFIWCNLIGTGRNGKSDPVWANDIGVVMAGIDTWAHCNTISGNAGGGILVTGIYNRVYDNNVGYESSTHCAPDACSGANGNGGSGIFLMGDGNNLRDNAIANNAWNGIDVSTGAAGNTFKRNHITNNGGLGIDLAPPGINSNNIDASEPPDAANGGLNFPIITSASASTMTSQGWFRGVVKGSLSTLPGKTYRITLFLNESCDSTHGEGKDRVWEGEIATSSANPGSDGQTEFEFHISHDAMMVGKVMTALATAQDGFFAGNTSEFSPCIPILHGNEPPNIVAQTFLATAVDGPVTIGPVTALDDGKPSGQLVFSRPQFPFHDVPFQVSPLGMITGTANFVANYSYEFTVEVSDGELQDTALVRILPPPNQAPVLADASFVMVESQNNVQVSLGPMQATDDGLPTFPGKLSFSPQGPTAPFTVTATGKIVGVPNFAANPNGYSFQVAVSDGLLKDEATVSIVPGFPQNRAPELDDRVFVVTPSQERQLLTLGWLTAQDDGYPSVPGKLVYSGPSAPTRFGVRPSGEVVGSADFASDPGGYQFAATVSDGKLSDSATIRVLPALLFRDRFE